MQPTQRAFTLGEAVELYRRLLAKNRDSLDLAGGADSNVRVGSLASLNPPPTQFEYSTAA